MPISLKNMRGCASPSSTAICTTSVSAATTPARRLNSYLSDHYRNLFSTNPAPCISDLPISPRPKHRTPRRDSSYTIIAPRRISSAEITDYLRRRRSSADVNDSLLLRNTVSFREDLLDRRDPNPLALVLSEPVVEAEELAPSVGPTAKEKPSRRNAERSRGLVPCSQTVVKSERVGSTYPSGEANGRSGFNHLAIVKSSSLPPARSVHQIVVLRVSLHCKGCENKLRKHLSKMEGVASYSIDLETRKVTVIGNVTPSFVLNSISKVKNAQFWPSPAKSTSSNSSSSLSGSSKSEFSY